MRGLEISKKSHFYDVSFSFGEKHIQCVKRHALVVEPLGDFCDFLLTHTLTFFNPKNGGPKPRKELEIWLLHRNFEPQDPPKAHSDRPFRVLGDVGGPTPAAHPVWGVREGRERLGF